MDTDTPDEHHRASAIPASADPGRPAMMIAIAYAAFGLSWVVLPDRLLRSVAPDVATLSAVGQGNGIAFVLASSALLYVVAARRRRAWPAEPLLREAHPHASAWLLGLGADKPVHAETRVATPDGDITERRGLQQRLRQWATVFDQIRDGVVITDARGRIHAVNRAFSTITGYSAQEAIGSGLRLLKSGRPGPEFYRQMWATLDECGHWQGEIWNRRKSGEVYPEWLTVTAVREDDDAVGHYVGVFTDVSRLKELGRNRFCFYSDDMNARAMNKLALEAAPSQAIERRELLHYQPKVDGRSGRVVGAEALLRWERQGIGLVRPGEFIPLAEHSSLILSLRLRVVAEGVETELQRDYLRGQHCDEMQGYHFARPGPAAALETLLDAQQASAPG